MPFNEPLERLKQAGEVDMLPLDVVIYALDIPGIDFHKAELLSVKFDYIYRLYTARNQNNGICRNSLMLWGFAISGRLHRGIWPVILRTSGS